MIKLNYDAGMDTYYLSGIIDNNAFNLPVYIRSGYVKRIDNIDGFNIPKIGIYINDDNGNFPIYVNNNINNIKIGDYIAFIENDVSDAFYYIYKDNKCYIMNIKLVLGIDKFMDLFYMGKEIDVNSNEYFCIYKKYNDFYGPLSIEQAYNNNPSFILNGPRKNKGNAYAYSITWKADNMPQIEIPASIYMGMFLSQDNSENKIRFITRNKRKSLYYDIKEEMYNFFENKYYLKLIKGYPRIINLFGKEYYIEIDIILERFYFEQVVISGQEVNLDKNRVFYNSLIIDIKDKKTLSRVRGNI